MTDSGTVRTEPAAGLGTRLQEPGELERQLLRRLQRQELVARNINALPAERLTRGDRVADRFTAAMGGWRFIIRQSAVLVI